MSFLSNSQISQATQDGSITIAELLTLLSARLSLEASDSPFDFSAIAFNSYERSGWSRATVAPSSTGFNVTLTHTDGASIVATYLESGQSWGNGYEVFQVKLQDHGDELLLDFASQANTLQTTGHMDILNATSRAITFTSQSSPAKNLSFTLGDIWRYSKDAAGNAYTWTQGINQNFFDYQHDGIVVTFTDRDASSGMSNSFMVGSNVDQVVRNYADVGYTFSNSHTGFAVAFDLKFDFTTEQADPEFVFTKLLIENPTWRLSMRAGELILHNSASASTQPPDIGLVIPGNQGVTVAQVEANVNQILLPLVFAGDNNLLIKAASSSVVEVEAGDDSVIGSAGADSISGGAGDDTIDGSGGVDTAVFSGRRADYLWRTTPSGDLRITDQRLNSPDGTDVLISVERLQFADITVPLVQSNILDVLGSAYFTEGYALAAGSGGTLFVAGATNGPVGGAVYSGNTDYFVAKYDLTGHLIWTAIDGSYDLDANNTPYAGGSDVAMAVASAANGSVFVGGYVNANFHGILNAGGYESKEGFVTLFDASGQRQWSQTISSSGDEIVYGLAVGAANAVYAVGVGGAISGGSTAGGDDAFLVKYDALGHRQWARQFGTAAGDAAYAVAVDAAGYVYMVGETGGNLNGVAGYGGQDAFLMKLTAAGVPVWTRVWGTANRELALAVTLADDGSIYVAGDSEGPLPGTTSHGGYDAFLSRFSADGTPQWTRMVGSSVFDQGFAVATAADGTVYVGGVTQGDVNGVAKSGSSPESSDGFVVAYRPDGSLQSTQLVGTPDAEAVRALVRGSDGQMYAAGPTNGALDGTPNPGFAAFLARVSGAAPESDLLQGMVYHWKSHALLSDVNLVAVAQPQSDPAKHLFEIRSVQASSTGGVEAQLWLNAGASVEDFLFQVNADSNASFSFTPHALTGWTVLQNDTPTGVSYGGYANDAVNAVHGAVQLGTVRLDLPQGVNSSVLHFNAGEAGNQGLSPYDVLLGSATATSEADGTYLISPLPVGVYNVEAHKALTANETGIAISAGDALAALKIAGGRNPNSDGLAVSPYQFIAADVNADHKVTATDALGVLKMAVNSLDAPERAWLFLDEKQDFWNETTRAFTTTRSSVQWPSVSPIDTATTIPLNLVAVLKGDVNGSWSAPAGALDLDTVQPNYFTDLAAKLGVPAAQWGII